MTNILRPATREEWLKLRHGYVSSTESAALFGKSPYVTAFELALQKTDKLESDFEGNERTRWGTRLQDAIALGIGEDYGVVVRPQNGYAVHPDAKMGASFDYEVVGVVSQQQYEDEHGPGSYLAWCGRFAPDGETILQKLYRQSGPGVLEIKNVDSLVYKNDWAEEVPAHIDIQLQHQLECIRYNWGVIGVLVGGNRHETVIRERDAPVGRAIKSKILKFWADLADGKMPPIIMPDDAEILIKLYNYVDPGKVYDGNEDIELSELCASYVEQGKIESLAKEAKEIAKAKILERIKDAEKAVMPGFGVSTWAVAEAPITFVRSAYRGFKVTPKKAKKAKTSGKK